MFSKVNRNSFISCIFVISIFADQQKEESHERSLNRQKRLLFFEPSTVWQLSMALVSRVSYIDSHRVAINSGFNINYNLPYNLSNFYKPTYFRSFENETSPIVEFFRRLAESDENFAPENSEKLVPTELPIENDDDKTESRNDVDHSTVEDLEATDDIEATTAAETETTKKILKKKSEPKEKTDLTAAELYAGIKDTLEIAGYQEDCLLKSICELARHPLGDHDHDVLYEILHFVLTPSVHRGFDPDTEENERKIYEEAEEIGKSYGNCELIYTSCKISPLDSISHFAKEDIND